MLSNDELQAYLFDLAIPEAGRQYVITSRETAPTRQIGRGAEQSITGHAFSQINQATRCFESREELAWIRRLEHQLSNILEYHAQPEKIQIYRHDKLGRRRYGSYTPDLLILHREYISVVDVKTSDHADGLISTHQKDWVLIDGKYQFLPAKEYFQSIGLCYRIGLAEEISRLEARNYGLLHQVRFNVSDPSLQAIAKITGPLSKHTYLTLGGVRSKFGNEGFETALWLIDRGVIHADLCRQSLVDDCAIVAATEELLHAAAAELHGRNTHNFDTVDASVLGNRKAVEHYVANAGAENGSSRTARRYRSKLKAASTGESRSAVLMPQFHLRGNRQCKIAPEVDDFLKSFIQDVPESNFTSKNLAFQEYKRRARKIHTSPPVSKKTFLARYKSLDPVALARKQGGRRAANQARPSSPVQKRHARAQRPFERVLMDHTPLDLFVKVAESSLGILTLRPWLTVVMDEATQFMLCYLLSFKQPSRRVFALMFRQIARRYGRVFEALHTDGGRDMDSIFTRQLAAEFTFTYSVSPGGNSRWNGWIESVFANVNASFVADYPANCLNWKSRAISRNFEPQAKVVDDLLALYAKFDEEQICYNHKVLSGTSLSRELHFRRLLEKFPMSGIPVQMDKNFCLATSIDSGDYKVSSRGTLQKLDRHYSPTAENLVTGPRKKEVREDPENPYMIYFLADGRWQTAVSPGYDRFDGLSDVVRVLEATHQFEGAEAKTHMDELARELKHEQLVAIAKEEMLSLERRKREAQFMTSSAPRRKMQNSGVFGELQKPLTNFDEQDD